MGNQATTKKPRPGERKRPTTLSLDQDVWDRLKEIEARTTAKPSSLANKLLREGLNLSPFKEA